MRRLVHETSRLELRPLRRSDYRTWFDAYAGGLPAKNRWDLKTVPSKKCTRTIFENFLVKHAQLAQKDECYIYGAFHHGVLIGVMDIGIYERRCNQMANFGYRIFNRYWKQGFGTEMARAGLKIGLRDLKLQRLEASIDLDNRASIKLAKAIGIEKEGIKKKYWLEDGKWQDQIIYVARPEHL